MAEYGQSLNRAFALKRTRLSFQVLLEFMPPLLHNRHGWNRGSVAQRTEGTAQHVFRQVINVIDVFANAAAGVEADQRFLQPIGAFAAGNTPSATLVPVKLHDAQGEFDHASLIVGDHHAARAQKFAALAEAVEIHVQLLGFFGSEYKG